jgi:hypothetical protein
LTGSRKAAFLCLMLLAIYPCLHKGVIAQHYAYKLIINYWFGMPETAVDNAVYVANRIAIQHK